MARMSDKAIGDADRFEHSETHGSRYWRLQNPPDDCALAPGRA
jgi:hypothetical protein